MDDKYEDFTSVGPGALAGRFLRMFWQPIYLSKNLKPGRPAAVQALGEHFTLYRGAGGTPYLVGDRCPHRGVQLSVGRVVGERIECFYHGWTFDGAGQCVAQPAERGGGGFARKVRIRAHPVQERYGLVFAYLGEGAPPDLPRLDALEREGTIENRESFRPWPFFTQLENGVDETHFNFTHRRTKFDDLGMNDEVPELSCEETDYGFVRHGRRGNAVRRGFFLMPNWSLSSNYEHDKGWADHVVWRVPVDNETHISFMADWISKTGKAAEDYFEGRRQARKRLKGMDDGVTLIRKVLRGEIHPDDIPADRPDIVFIQDGISCMSQGTRRDREADLLAASDVQVAMLRRLWTRELRALRNGAPMRNWTIPRDLETTKGVEEAS